MSATLLAHSPAHADSRLAVCCELCSAEATLPADETLHRVVWLVWDAPRGDLTHGRDANGWLLVSHETETLPYCPSHGARKCLRHAAAHFGMELPEGLR